MSYKYIWFGWYPDKMPEDKMSEDKMPDNLRG